MDHSAVKRKVKEFARSNDLYYEIVIDTKKNFYEIRIEKDNVSMTIRIDFQTAHMCRIDIISNRLSYMLLKIDEKLSKV